MATQGSKKASERCERVRSNGSTTILIPRGQDVQSGPQACGRELFPRKRQIGPAKLAHTEVHMSMRATSPGVRFS